MRVGGWGRGRGRGVVRFLDVGHGWIELGRLLMTN